MSKRTPGLDQLRNELEVIAREPIEAIDARLDELEARLMRAIEGDRVDRGLVVVPIDVARRRRLSVRVVGGVAGAACIIALILVSAAWFGGADPEIVIAAADDVSVVLPDGSVVSGAAGLELPDGSRLDVDGSLVVDGRTYGPGEYFVGPDGITAVSGAAGEGVTDVATTTSSAPKTAPPSTAPPTTTRRSVPDVDRPVGTAAPPTTASDRPAGPSTSVRSTEPPRTVPEVTRPRNTVTDTVIDTVTGTGPDTSQPPQTSEPTRSTTTTAPTTIPTRPTTTTPRPTTTTARDVASGSGLDGRFGGGD